jgi:hypothetical protein
VLHGAKLTTSSRIRSRVCTVGESIAVVMAKGCPGLSSGGSVKVYEAMQMG